MKPEQTFIEAVSKDSCYIIYIYYKIENTSRFHFPHYGEKWALVIISVNLFLYLRVPAAKSLIKNCFQIII